jgi:hypothetical protein
VHPNDFAVRKSDEEERERERERERGGAEYL